MSVLQVGGGTYNAVRYSLGRFFSTSNVRIGPVERPLCAPKIHGSSFANRVGKRGKKVRGHAPFWGQLVPKFAKDV